MGDRRRLPRARLAALAAQLDTAALARPGIPTRALAVFNETDRPFAGLAVLRVDFRTRALSPVAVFSPAGEVLASRIEKECIGPLEADGRRRWTFDLLFAADIPARTAIACAAVWAPAPAAIDAADWAARSGQGSLEAIEVPCRPGLLKLPLELEPWTTFS